MMSAPVGYVYIHRSGGGNDFTIGKAAEASSRVAPLRAVATGLAINPRRFLSLRTTDPATGNCL
jgi:hypothetical protein